MPLSKQKRKEVDKRRKIIEREYNKGTSLQKIADKLKLGWSVNRLLREINLMREQGWDLPHRYDKSRRKKMGTPAPKQKARRKASAKKSTTKKASTKKAATKKSSSKKSTSKKSSSKKGKTANPFKK